MEELFRFSVVRATTKAQQPSSVMIGGATQKPLRGGTGTPPFSAPIQTEISQLAAAGLTGEALWQRLEPLAVQWLLQNATAILSSALWGALNGFVVGLEALASETPPPQTFDEAAIQTVFDEDASLNNAVVATYNAQLGDLFVALMIVRRGGPSALAKSAPAQNVGEAAVLLGSTPALTDIAQLICACNIFLGGASELTPPNDATDPQASYGASLGKALAATVLMPPGFFAALSKPVLGVGFRELQVVKQNIRRYQLSEISRIENILQGESREHIQRHKLSTETDTTDSESTTTETDKELSTDDRTSVSNEASSQVQSDTSIAAGVQAQYSSPSYKLQADLNVSYHNSSSQTSQFSSNTAKDVTQKAASKVTEVITRTETTKVIEAFYDKEKQKFDNSKGTANVSGVYQWLEKVYLSQTFNLGRHMLIDITVPEPGANLLAMATSTPNQNPPPVQPHPLGTILKDAANQPILDNYGNLQLDVPLNPLSLSTQPFDPNFYGNWVALYGATGVSAPPAVQLTFSKGETFDYKDDTDKTVADQIQIDDGYGAVLVQVSVTAMRNDNPGTPYSENVYVDVAIAGVSLHLPWPNSQRSTVLTQAVAINPAATGNVNFTIYGHNIDQMSVNVELTCQPQSSLGDQWKLQTYEKIVDAYNNLQQTYNAAVAARKVAAQEVGPLGAEDPAANLQTAQIELKRSCIAIFDNNNGTVSGQVSAVQMNPAVQPTPPNVATPQLPEPILDVSQSLGARVRWFEQAFEWENIAYVMYPYFWGRRSRWVPNMTLSNDDPVFLSFLRAGYARVVVPVRLGFERAVHFYLHTGLPWLGGDLPPVGDKSQNPLYLDVAEEIKNLTGGGYSGEVEIPVGDPWEYVLPTTLISLNEDGTLPQWHRVAPAGIAPGDPTYSSDAPDGPWTWQDGPPPTGNVTPTAASSKFAAAKLVKKPTERSVKKATKKLTATTKRG